MWVNEVIAAIVGLSGGMVVATALAAFIIGLGIIPRYAGVTHTGHNLLLYEDALILGTFLGNILYLYQFLSDTGDWLSSAYSSACSWEAGSLLWVKW